MARRLWLAYAIATLAVALLLLALYANAYDDYDVGARLRGVGRFLRLWMSILAFPFGPLTGLVAEPPLRRAFGCDDDNDPCAIFIVWQVQFAALLAQIVLLRWLLARWGRAGP